MAFYGAQLQCTQSATIPGTNNTAITDAERRIIFDTPLVTGTNVVSHDRGLITISEKGNFFISWFVTVRTGLGDSGVTFSLKEDHYSTTDPEGTILSSKAYPSTNSVKTGQLAGSAILQIADGQICRLGLYNTGTDEATLAVKADGTDMVNANITIQPYVAGSYSTSYGLVGMNLTMDNTSTESLTLGADGVVKFNKDDNTFDTIFKYVATTGRITTLVSGSYLVDWAVNIDGSEDVSAISFSLMTTAGTLAKFDSTLMLQNTFTGFAYITTTANQEIWLANTSKTFDNLSASLTYSNIATRAKLRIVGHS